MAKTPLSKIHRLAAIVDAQLHQFEPMEPDGDEALGASSQPEMKKKKNPLLRAGMAGATVAGASAIAANKDKIKAGTANAKEAGRTAIFRGMRKTAGAMNKAGNAAKKFQPPGISQQGLGKAGDLLKKGAKSLRKKSMKFFDAGIAEQLVRIERKVRAAGA